MSAEDRLLSGRNLPSITEREAVFDAVLAELDAKGELATRKPARWTWALPVLVFSLGASAVAVVSNVLWLPQGELTPRGDKADNVELSCFDACRRGSVLAVTVDSSAPYFSAFSQAPDGTVTWYFTNVAIERGRHQLGQAILLREHAVGTHQFWGLFSDERLTRDELRARFDELTRVERSFTVLP